MTIDTQTTQYGAVVKPSILKTVLRLNYGLRRPTYIWGGTGIGKSDIHLQVTEELGIQCIDCRASQLDPVDIRGLPTLNGDGKAHWATPAFLPTQGAGIFFCDELNLAPELVQASFYQLILSGKLGDDYYMPKTWVTNGAGNTEDFQGVRRMMPPLANRFAHYLLEPDLDDWITWANTHGIHPSIISFLRTMPHLLYQFDKYQKSFPTPRSWEAASNVIWLDQPKGTETVMLESNVGKGATIDYLSHLQLYRELPSFDGILTNPKTAKIPNSAGGLYAVASRLAYSANPDNINAVITYLNRLPVEYGVMAVKDAQQRCPELAETDGIIEWMVRHSSVVFGVD